MTALDPAPDAPTVDASTTILGIETSCDETGVGISSMRGRLIELGGRLDLEPGDDGLRLRARLRTSPSISNILSKLNRF